MLMTKKDIPTQWFIERMCWFPPYLGVSPILIRADRFNAELERRRDSRQLADGYPLNHCKETVVQPK